MPATGPIFITELFFIFIYLYLVLLLSVSVWIYIVVVVQLYYVYEMNKTKFVCLFTLDSLHDGVVHI